MYTLDRETPLPMYFQLKKQMLEKINDQTYKIGDMLPTESEFVEALKISRATVRQAFSELVAEGYLYRQKGKGTFVAAPKINARFLNRLKTFNEEIEEKGMTPSTQVLGLERVEAIGHINRRLKLPEQDALIYMKRLRSANDEVIQYQELYIPYEPYKELLNADFSKRSLYAALEQDYDVRVNRVIREIEPVIVTGKEAALLQVPAGSPISLVKTLSFWDETPVEYAISRFRGDKVKFTVELYR